MADKVVVQKVQLKERKTFGEFIREMGLSEKYHAILVNGRKVTNLDTILELDSKIVILPRIRGG